MKGNLMHPLDRRIAKLEPPPRGNIMHVIRSDNDEDAHAKFEELGAAHSDLCIWLKRFTESPAPPEHLYSKPMGS
jgi:hypothetical protein